MLEEHGYRLLRAAPAVYDRTQVEFKRDAFRYDQEKDRYICPNGKTLRAKRLYRSDSGLFWEYWAEREDCRACPLREKCLSANDRQGARKLSDSYFKPSVQRHLSRWKEPDYKQALKQRQIWCEGTFAIQKRCHKLNARLTTRLRGSGGPLPPFRDRFEPQKNDLGHHLTPEGVFFLPMIYFPLLNGDFVNGPILSRSPTPCGASPAWVFLFGRSFCFQGAVHR